jgi:ribose transport system permease protein
MPGLSMQGMNIPIHVKKVIGAGFFLILLCLLVWLGNPNFFKAYNVQNLLRRTALLSIFAIGEGFVIMSAGIDLSVGSLVGMAGITHAFLVMEKGVPIELATPFMLVVGVVVGLSQGTLVTRLRVAPFIATLGGMMVFRGLAKVIAGDRTYGYRTEFPFFRQLATGHFLGVPIPFWILLIIAAATHILLTKTVYGRYLLATGRNPEAARCSGINTRRVVTVTYLISGTLAVFAGMLYAADLNSCTSQLGTMYELHAIAAAVIGGCSLRGGEGSVIGIVIGAAILKVLEDGITLLWISPQWELVVIGLVLILAVLMDMAVQKQAEKRAAASRMAGLRAAEGKE